MNYVDLIEPLLLCDQLKLNRSVTDKQIENPQRDSYIIKSKDNNNSAFYQFRFKISET